MSISIKNVSFRYPIGPVEKGPTVVTDLTLEVAPGSRYMLVGGNGAGKSTILALLGGLHFIRPADSILVCGREAFTDRTLNGIRVLMAPNWAHRKMSFVGASVPYSGDFPVSEMSTEWQTMYPERAAKLVKVLGIDLSWRLAKVSDGQRRRIQLFLNLIRPFEVLLLDEVLSVLDVLVRQDFLDYLKEETEQRGCTVMYATHVFDGLEDWATDILYLKAGGKLQYAGPVPKQENPSMFRLVRSWLLEERAAGERVLETESGQEAHAERNALAGAQNQGGGYTSGRIGTDQAD